MVKILTLLLLFFVGSAYSVENINNNIINWKNKEQISRELRIEIENYFIKPMLKNNKKELIRMTLDPDEGSLNQIGIKIKWLNGDRVDGLLRYTDKNIINRNEYMEWQYPCNPELEVCE